MMLRALVLWAALNWVLLGQTPCPETPVYSPCNLVFDLDEQEASAYPNPYIGLELRAEFRSPEHRTFLVHAFWDGGRRMVLRFSPTEAGQWDYRISSNIDRWNGKQGHFTASASDAKGFVRVANVHHFTYTEGRVRPIPHLWMGDTSYRFAVMDRGLFERMVDVRAEQKFNHIRGLVLGDLPGMEGAFTGPDQPNPDYFRELDERILYMNSKGITADLVLAGDGNHLVELFGTRQQRERYIRYVVSRYAPMNVTWQGVQEFEEYKDGRGLLREIGELLKNLDPYQHPRSTHTAATSSPLLNDGWMDYIVYKSSDNALGAIEHQLYTVPQVNAEFACEDSGAGASSEHHVNTDTFRRRLWNTTMNGMYPTFGNTGVYGGREFKPDVQYLDSPGARQMTHWYDFFTRTRHWELEPYFDVDGGRALALTGIEYIVYVEKPGPVELLTEKKSYQVYWFNPVSGDYIKQKKDYKGERFAGQPPDSTHDWVLHLSRDGRKKDLLSRWYFETRQVPIQDVELNPKRLPYEIVEPANSTLPVGEPVPYAVKLTRETRATSSMLYLWTGEVTAGGQGHRVLGIGAKGTFQIPRDIVMRFPGVLNLRLLGMNAHGKVYSVNRIFKLAQ